MVLQALNRYYDILAGDPASDIPRLGYSIVPVSFALNLSNGGEVLDVLHLYETVQRGREVLERPLPLNVPEQAKKSSNIVANFLCGTAEYVLGLTGKHYKDSNFASRCFHAFRKLNLAILKEVDCLEAEAVRRFLDCWDPLKAQGCLPLHSHLEEMLRGSNIVFMLDGSPGFIHEHPAVRRSWEEYRMRNISQTHAQCLVTGVVSPIARLHPSLKGIKGAQSSGATLVGFNADAYTSFGKVQGGNSPVSEKATFAYTTALNHLLSKDNPNRKFNIGDTTVVYWAESPDPAYPTLFQGLFSLEAEAEAAKGARKTGSRNAQAEERLREVAKRVKGLQPADTTRLLEGLDPKIRFYVLGLAPNAARASVRFFHADLFGSLVEKIMRHYRDMEMVREFIDQPEFIPLWQVLNETFSKKEHDGKPSPIMAGAMFRAILEDAPYPAALYYAVLNRIRADVDDKRKNIQKINRTRASVIKAYLKRKYRHQEKNPIQEDLYMSLNEKSTNPAYLLGRLFAALEKAQKDAIPNLNATIKDRYFTNACAAPASVFPVLLRLSQHHISKEKNRYIDQLIGRIVELLDIEKNPIPTHLSLDEQGAFILGYYHQRTDLYTPKADRVKDKEAAQAVN